MTTRAVRWALITQAVEVLGQLIAGVAIARLLGPSDYGMLATALALAALVAPWVLFGSTEVALTLHAERKLPVWAVLTAHLKLAAIGGATALTVGTAAGLLLADTLAGAATIVILLLTLACNAAAATANALIVGRGACDEDALRVLVTRGALAAGSVVAAGALKSVVAVAAVYLLSSAALAASRWWWIHRRVAPCAWQTEPGLLSDMWRRSRRLGVAGLLGGWRTRADTMMLQVMAGSAAVGVFAVPNRFVTVVDAGAAAVALARFPALAHRRGAQPGGYVLAGVLIALLCCSAALLDFTPLLNVLLGDGYAASGGLLRVLCLAAAARAVNAFAAKVLVAMQRERGVLRAQAVGLVVNVVANAMWIPSMGPLGAAWATVVAESACTVLLLFAVTTRRR